MIKLSIITVVKDDYEGLIDTIHSVEKYTSPLDVEHIIWVCDSSKNLDKFRLIDQSSFRVVLIDDDEGIWDAMNKALLFAKGNFQLFLNARDVLIAPLNVASIRSGCLLRVEYFDWFGRLRLVKCSKFLQYGIPYCHQGIIFKKKEIKYNVRYKFGADYLYILDTFDNWPPPQMDGPIIHYDSSGISSNRRFEADLWGVRCVYERFGLVPASYVLARSIGKLIIRTILRPFRKLIYQQVIKE